MNSGEVMQGSRSWSIQQADCLAWVGSLPETSIDLFFFSPPYEKARLYLEGGANLGIARDAESWVAWMVDVFKACLRACKGLVACVCEGQTKQYRYSCSPALLMADLHRAGVNLRKPPIFHRVGIPGSGGPDWLRNDYEFIICATRTGKLPWSDNTACGHPPKWAPGGPMSHRAADGTRVNGRHDMFAGGDGSRGQGRNKDGSKAVKKRLGRSSTKGSCLGLPTIANPGNVLTFRVGGGRMGHKLAHKNEAPFPLGLAEFFVRSFCPPGGLVCDPFSGSGTTLHAAILHGRRFVGCDLRQSQVDLSIQRARSITPDFIQ